MHPCKCEIPTPRYFTVEGLTLVGDMKFATGCQFREEICSTIRDFEEVPTV